MTTSEDLPLVTIMIPTYNQASVIDRAILSALAQDYSRLEVVVADDRSSDNTEIVCKAFLNDPRFKYFKNETNLGRVANYKKVLANYAKGKWVLNLDGDDYLIDPTYIRRAVALAEANSDMTLVFARQRFKNALTGYERDQARPEVAEINNGTELLLKYDQIKEGVSHITAFYLREHALKSKVHENNHIAADTEAVLRIIAGKKVGFIDSVVGVWNQHEVNESGTQDFEKRIAYFDMINKPYDYFVKNKLVDLDKLKAWRVRMLSRLTRENMAFYLDKGECLAAFKIWWYSLNQFGLLIAVMSLKKKGIWARLILPSFVFNKIKKGMV